VVPTARESANWKRKDKCPRDCNVYLKYLKWAYVEAANLISAHSKHWAERHVVQLYQRVKESIKMHGKATVAVARHLAEASYWTCASKRFTESPKTSGKFFRRRTGKRDCPMAIEAVL
jgi:hypothetical protein